MRITKNTNGGIKNPASNKGSRLNCLSDERVAPENTENKMAREKTEEQIRKEMLETQAIMEEVMHDPEVRQAMADAQRECGTLTPEELRRPFTI